MTSRDFFIMLSCMFLAVPHVPAQNVPTPPSNAPPAATSISTQATDKVEITLRSGEVYRNCKVTRVEPDGITVMHAKGVAKLPFVSLPDEYQTMYKFDPASAATYAKAMAKQRAQAWARQQEEQQRQQAEANQREQEKKAMKQAVDAKGKALKSLAQRLQAGIATTADCKALVGCTTNDVTAIMGSPDGTHLSGSTYDYRSLIDPESLRRTAVFLEFEGGVVTNVWW